MLNKRMLQRILAGLGILLVSLALGIFAGNQQTARADIHHTDNINMPLEFVAPDGTTQEAVTLTHNNISVADANKTTVKDFIDTAGLNPALAKGHTILDMYNILFEYADQPALKAQAVKEMQAVFADMDQATAESLVDQGIASIKSFSGLVFDTDRITQEENETLSLDLDNPYTQGADITSYHTQQPFKIYLKKRAATTTTTPAITTPAVVDQSSLTADDTATVTVGDPVNAATFNAHATTSDGQNSPVTVDTGKADLQQPGTYTLTLKAANGKTKSVTLTVQAAPILTGAAAATIAPKRSAVYALKTLYLYQQPTFKKRQRIVKYRKTKRTQRPMFVVTGYANSKAGLRRYRVRDVNHHSKTAGKTGYITARAAFVTPVYYHQTAKKIKVINPSGVNVYRNLKLTKQVKHVKHGQTLKVTAVKQYHLTTRFTLSNGQYVTANKKLVMRVK